MKLTQRTCLIAVLLLFAAPCLAQESNLYSFEITSVRDGNTLDAQWRPTPKGFDFYEHTPKLDLAGIWSEPTREPPGAYERRVAFMKSLVGRTVQASTRTVAYASRQPDTGTYYLHLYIVHPTEVWLDDKSSLNELLLADGYAMLDEGTSSPLTSLELSRLRAAETGARQAHKGIWGEPTDLYASEKARMLRERELFSKQKQSAGFLRKVQGVFVISVLWLAYLVRKNPDNTLATLALLLIPLGVLLPDLIRFHLTPAWIRSNPLAANAFIVALVLMGVAMWIFAGLVRRGPAEQWGAVGVGVSRGPKLLLFFAGLWLLIFSFAVFYRSAQHVTFALAFRDSISIALGLPTVSRIPATIGAIAEKVASLVWVGVCAVLFPPKSTLPEGTGLWNVSVAIASFSIIVIAVASIFSASFLMVFESDAITNPVNHQECFILAGATLFRQSYSGLPVRPNGIWFLQFVEANVGMLLALVGLRVIYATASGAAVRASGTAASR